MRGELRLILLVVALVAVTFGCAHGKYGEPKGPAPYGDPGDPEKPDDPEEPEEPEPPGFDLDHFLCYEGMGGTMRTEPVELEDQFDRLRHQKDKVEVIRPMAFCNPVAKTRLPDDQYGEREEGEIQKPDHHLVGYQIRSRSDRPWSAVFINQIHPSGARLHFRLPQFLLVPTQKLAPKEHPEPVRLDHFKCYPISDPGASPGVFDLKDQFGGLRRVELTGARAICAPVHKQREGYTMEKAAGDVHLVCYGVRREADGSVRYQNQFEPRGGMQLSRVFGLCVPSRKEGVRREEN